VPCVPGTPTFKTIEELGQALLAFRETYNTTWLIFSEGDSIAKGFQADVAVSSIG
jgi:hypothetical protein